MTLGRKQYNTFFGTYVTNVRSSVKQNINEWISLFLFSKNCLRISTLLFLYSLEFYYFSEIFWARRKKCENLSVFSSCPLSA
jgi:hypothetical protein